MEKPQKGEPLLRYLSVRDEQSINEEDRTMRFPVCSDKPVRTWFGDEILSHEPGAMRKGERQQSMPLLFNHDRDKIIGVVTGIEQDAGRTYATVRFADTEEGNKAFSLVRDHVLVNVSVGYRVFEYTEKPDSDEVRATDWELLEVSLVTVPADESVGVYRSFSNNQPKEGTMDTTKKNEGQTPAQPAAPVSTVNEDEVRAAERERIAEIDTMCRDFHIDDNLRNELISKGTRIDAARAAIMEHMRTHRQEPAGSNQRGIGLDLSVSERRGYSIVRALNAALSGNWKDAGFEREVSQEFCRQLDRDTNGFFMPTNIPAMAQRDYVVGTPANGGNLVPTDLLASSFIEALREKAVVTRLGATMLTGLRGNVEIPRQNGVSAAQWISETGTVTGSNATFDKVPLKMKTIAAKSFISRNMLIQASLDIETFVRSELIRTIALGVDQAAFFGSGQNGEPTGISGFVTPTAISNLDFDALIDMETQVAAANADADRMAYVTDATVIGALKKLKDKDDNYIWKPITEAVRNLTPGEVNGYPVARANQTRVVGQSATNSHIFFGNWSDLVIGEWGVVEILPNPYSAAAYDNGGVEIRALQSLDVAVRHPESFVIGQI